MKNLNNKFGNIIIKNKMNIISITIIIAIGIHSYFNHFQEKKIPSKTNTIKKIRKIARAEDNIENKLSTVLVLDLNEDGKINTTNVNKSKIFFDLSGNDMSNQTAWITKEDGFLVYDKNRNGQIDNITELFGNPFQTGFEELKELFDSNRDDIIDKNDLKFSELKIWKDLNQDGKSMKNKINGKIIDNELHSLDSLNIKAINLRNKNINIVTNGNILKQKSTFTKSNKKNLIANIEFKINKSNTSYAKPYILTAEALLLPWLRGYGNINSAHVEYSINKSFLSFAKEFSKKDVNYINSNFDIFIKKWTRLGDLHKKYNIKRDYLTMDDKVWIMENIIVDFLFKKSIEDAFKANKKSSNLYNEEYINIHFNDFRKRNFLLFIMQATYKKVFRGSYYNDNGDNIKVNNKKLLEKSILSFYNKKQTKEDLIYVSTIIHTFKSYFKLNGTSIENKIKNKINKEIIHLAFFSKNKNIQLSINKILKKRQ